MSDRCDVDIDVGKVEPWPALKARRMMDLRVRHCPYHFRLEVFYLGSLIGSVSEEVPDEEQQYAVDYMIDRVLNMDARSELVGREL